MTRRGWMAALVVLACLVPMAAAAQSTEGSLYFRQYCASCHGLQGHGDGPSAATFKARVPDLTRLQPAGQPFPSFAVINAIDGTRALSSHAQSGMPMWGNVFRYTKTPPREVVIWTLVQHLKAVQVNRKY